MVFGRWYPQATLLGSGKALVTSGHDYYNLITVGGIDETTAFLDDMRRFRMRQNDPGWNQDPTEAPRPAPREGHVMIYDAYRRQVILFGGRNGSGTDTLKTIWRLKRTDTHSGERWEWKAMGRGLPDPTTGGLPALRADAAVARIGYRNDEPESIQKADTLVMFGGRTVTGGGASAALDTLWYLKLGPNDNQFQWQQVVCQSGGPGARYDHVAMSDPGQCLGVVHGNPDKDPLCTQGAPVPLLIVHGGRRSDGSLAGDTVWAAPLPRSGAVGNPQWNVIATGGPGTRAGHAAVPQPFRRTGWSNNCNDARIEFFLFGGKDASQVKSDLWNLSRADSINTPQPWVWRQVTPSPSTPCGRPTLPPRMGHALTYDREFHRLVVFGGDTTGSGARINDLWSLSLGFSAKCGGTVPAWSCISADSAAQVAKRSGHTIVQETYPVFARVPERYTVPKEGAAAQSESLTYAQRRQPLYPHMYLLTSGRLFYTGNDADDPQRTSYDLDLSDLSQPWKNARASGAIGGASTLVRRDSIMKCGGNNVLSHASNVVKWIPANTTLPWNSSIPMTLSRANHNVTMLPTGQVLVTGGTASNGTTYHREPEMWTLGPGDAVGSWSGLLAPDLYNREYHSTALLLPDGRVLTSGGIPSQNEASIFWPPYLFANGTYRSRPTIAPQPTCNLDAPISYNESFRVHFTPTTDAIGSACLMRPSGTTHQSDMNQRYIPLSFDSVGVGYVKLRAPADSNVAPPGDHLLFIVRTDGTPAVAKWVRLERDLLGPVVELQEAMAGPNSVTLDWAAPGDDGTIMLGRAVSYDLRYSTNPITEGNFNSCLQWGTGSPKCAGALESVTINGLQNCNLYHFGLKAFDELGQANLVTTQAMSGCGGFGPLAGGGDEGGGSLRIGASPLTARSGMTEGSQARSRLTNSILSPAIPGESVEDWLVVNPVENGTTGSVELLQLPGSSVVIDEAKLLTVDHQPSDDVLVTPTGMIVGSRRPANVTRRSSGEPLSYPADVRAGDTIFVSLGTAPNARPRLGIAVESFGKLASADAQGFTVHGVDDTLREYIVPRANHSETAVPVRSDSVRLVFGSPHRIHRISAVDAPSGEYEVTTLSPTASIHSRLGDITTLLLDSDTLRADGVANDSIRLVFALPALVTGHERTFVLRARGKSTTRTANGTGGFSLLSQALPRKFSLRQNHPNPFSYATTIHFDLPITSTIELAVFDIAGRRIRTLEQRSLRAGTYAVSWDRRDGNSNVAPPGVYLYRLRAGDFIDRQRMIVLP